MYKLSFYVPSDYLTQVKEALFDAGAGRLGAYDRCSWEVLGQGQFRPLIGSHPHRGSHHQVEQVDEYLVEMMCDSRCIQKVIAALKDAHPYEVPAYSYYQVEV